MIQSLTVERIGSHRLAVADLFDRPLPAFLDAVEARPTWIYSDPPWGSGNLHFWQTFNKEASHHDFSGFLDAWSDLLETAQPQHVWLEMGRKWALETRAHLQPALPPFQQMWTTFYRGGGPTGWLPVNLLYFAYDPVSLQGSPEGMKGEASTAWVFDQMRPIAGPVLDPCMGLGMVARQAVRTGKTAYGLEVNPRRLAKTTTWLRAHVTA